MTLISDEIFNACEDGAVVTATFDDKTGAAETLAWKVEAGVLTIPGVTIAISGDSGQVKGLPGLRLTPHEKGGWFLFDADGQGIAWGENMHLGAGRWREVDAATRRQQAEAQLAEMQAAQG